MNRTQRQTLFDRFFSALAREYARGLSLDFAGTIRKLPPPPLPGEVQGPTRYYVNTLVTEGAGGTRLVEFNDRVQALLLQAEAWAETGQGAKPDLESVPGLVSRRMDKKTKSKRKV